MANLLAQTGNHAGAGRHRDKGYRGRSITTLPYRGTQAPLPILLLVSALDGNIPIRQFLDDRVFLTSVVVAEYYQPNCPLPPHRLIFNSIGDPDLDWVSLAKGMGIPARRVDSLEQLLRGLHDGLHANGPSLIEIPL